MISVVGLEDEMKRSYLDYAMSVIIGRAIPDIKDGLKPVHRRVLYAMYESGTTWNKPYKKSARIVGDVIGKYHPHGDQAAYDTLVRMAQDFSLRYLLVDGQGNFGSIDGDPPAAMRYTEVRMTKLAGEMLADIEKDTVNFVPNYDESLTMPEVLPAKFPNLLVNGGSGIAVGMATNIPPHNLGEVVDGLVHLIQHPNASLDKIMEFIPGPDFPTGGYIFNRQGIRDAYRDGRGVIQLRAKTKIERGGDKGERDRIVVTEIPYAVNKATLLETIAELVNDKKLEGIADLRDESDREGIRVVVEVKRGELPGDRPQQPLQAHRAPDLVRHHHAGHRRQAAQDPDPDRHDEVLHLPPPGRHPAADPVRPEEGRGPGPHPRGPDDRPGPPGRHHQAHPRLQERRRGPDGAHRAVQALARSRPRPSWRCSSSG